jgi:hypothetical protein
VEFKGHPILEDLSSHLGAESPRCAVIVAAAFFDETLKTLLADDKERSFFARIKDGLEWGLLRQDEGADLNALRELRNSFAHDLRVKDFDAASGARVEAMRTWRIASDARPLDRVIQTPLTRLLFVVGVIAFRLYKRTKPPAKSGPRPEPLGGVRPSSKLFFLVRGAPSQLVFPVTSPSWHH